MRWGIWLAGLFLVSALAGCADGGKPLTSAGSTTTSAARPTSTEDTGSITGQVLDDEVQPIAGADVALTGAKGIAPVKSDTQGRYTFNALTPGDYVVFVQQLGFESAQKTIKVQPGLVSYGNFSLVPIPISVARQRAFITETYFEFGAGASVVGSYYGNVSGALYRDIYYTVEPDVVGAASGMKWAAAPGTAKRMYVELWVADKSCASGTLCSRLNRTQGLSPLIVRSNGYAEHAEGTKKIQVNPAVGLNYCYASSAPTNVNDCVANPDTFAQVIFQQRIKLYTTVFFVEPAPEAFNPLPP